jgi:hypothetical protein
MVFERDFLARAVDRNAGIVDPGVEAAKPFDGSPRHALQVVKAADISGDRDSFTAPLAALISHLLQGLTVAGDKNQARARLLKDDAAAMHFDGPGSAASIGVGTRVAMEQKVRLNRDDRTENLREVVSVQPINPTGVSRYDSKTVVWVAGQLSTLSENTCLPTGRK